MNRDYYYIDLHATIDAIKYRISHLTKKINDLHKPSDEKKDYICPRCKATWTQLDVVSNIDPVSMEFLCNRCNFVLEKDEASVADVGGNQRSKTLMSQLDPLLVLLQKIDSETIPQNNFETALMRQTAVEREDTNQRQDLQPVKSEIKTEAGKGIKIENVPLMVNVDTAADALEAVRKEAERKAKAVAQNALPVWTTTSTVTGHDATAGVKEKERLAQMGGTIIGSTVEEDKKNENAVVNAQIAAYMEQVAREEAEAAAKAAEEGSSEEEDEEDEFEDVLQPDGGPGTETPNSTLSAGAITGTKRKADDDSESGVTTEVNTPMANGTGGESPGKRLKLEEADDDDDDAEFEDV